jgi:hypothetical protein
VSDFVAAYPPSAGRLFLSPFFGFGEIGGAGCIIVGGAFSCHFSKVNGIDVGFVDTLYFGDFGVDSTGLGSKDSRYFYSISRSANGK